jgi:chromosome segregation ATPase
VQAENVSNAIYLFSFFPLFIFGIPVPQATGLQRTREELQSSMSHMEATEKDLDNAEGKLKGKLEAVQLLKRELSELLALDQFSDQIRAIYAKMLWLDVYTEDEFLKKLQEGLDEIQADVDAAKETLRQAEEEEGKIGSLDEINAALGEAQEEHAKIAADAESKRRDANSHMKQISQLQREVRQLVDNKAEHAARLDAVKREVGTLTNLTRYTHLLSSYT